MAAMTIRLTKDMEQIVHDAVRAGLYAREEEVIPDLLARLRESLPEKTATPSRKARRTKPAPPEKTLMPEEFDQRLIELGLMSRLPDSDADFDDPDDQPVALGGEPLSETVIRLRKGP
jgi:Arc/MetJ-type ribon-helix-helix transcriptional regulator